MDDSFGGRFDQALENDFEKSESLAAMASKIEAIGLGVVAVKQESLAGHCQEVVLCASSLYFGRNHGGDGYANEQLIPVLSSVKVTRNLKKSQESAACTFLMLTLLPGLKTMTLIISQVEFVCSPRRKLSQ